MTEAERIEDVDGFSFSKGYTEGFDASSKKFEEQLKETRKAVASINTKLQSATAENSRLQQLIKDKEEIIRELLPLAHRAKSGMWANDPYALHVDIIIDRAKPLLNQ